MYGNLPVGGLQGNGASTIAYTANGEASDFMLSQFGIFAISPELGTSNPATGAFYIEQVQDLKDVLSKNYKWLNFAAYSLHPRIDLAI